MISFKQFLEAKDTDTVPIRDYLNDSCAPLIREMGSDFLKDPFDLPMYRGVTFTYNEPEIELDLGHDDEEWETGYIKKVRKDRKPLDTHPQIAKILDEIFEKEFGWRPRTESVFVYGRLKRSEADEYGRLCRIFPMGDLKFLWSPKITDLTGTVGNLFAQHGFDLNLHQGKPAKDTPRPPYEPEVLAKIREMLMDEIPKRGYTNENLVEALNSRSEIMISCNQYLAIKA